MNAPARALLTSPRVDRQTAVADHFVIRTSIRAEARTTPAPRAPTISRHHCLEATDQLHIQLLGCAADGATDNTDTDTDIHRLASQFWNQPMQSLIN
ncbi:hypothetical protein BSLG_000619 [Batrachochytrium salamandrivorans]|nr:hypothetical protein BSLG_000619 [Batrachochytrium salamandrivorans]